jgi:hypothetical protein
MYSKIVRRSMLLATGIRPSPYKIITPLGTRGMGWVRASRISEK